MNSKLYDFIKKEGEKDEAIKIRQRTFKKSRQPS